MKRVHLHIRVYDIDANVEFYSCLFGVRPSLRQPDYASWILEDPRMSFAISARTGSPGLEQLGIRVDTEEEFSEVREQFAKADASTTDESVAYGELIPDGQWLIDPQGILWEAAMAHREAPFIEDRAR